MSVRRHPGYAVVIVVLAAGMVGCVKQAIDDARTDTATDMNVYDGADSATADGLDEASDASSDPRPELDGLDSSDVTARDAHDATTSDSIRDAVLDVVDGGSTDASPDVGCDADLRSDPNNCGACGHACFGSSPICECGHCTTCDCSGGRCTLCWYFDSDAGCSRCVASDLTVDPSHCGTCGTACDAGQLCTAGVCM